MRLFFIIAVSCLLTVPAKAQTVSLSTGVDFSTGDYGAETDTDFLFIPVSAQLRFDAVSLRIFIPYLSIDGPGDVLPGDGAPILTDRCQALQDIRPQLFARFCQTTQASTQAPTLNDDGSASGLGDIVLAADFTLPEKLTGDFGVTFGGRVKLPTADKEAALGTGETDVALDMDIAYYGAPVTPFVTLGYRFLGDPTFEDALGTFTVELQNGLTASTGVSVPVGKANTLTLAYDFLEGSIRSAPDVHEVSAAFTVPVSDSWSLTGYAVTGLTDASPDIAVGLSLRTTFGL